MEWKSSAYLRRRGGRPQGVVRLEAVVAARVLDLAIVGHNGVV